jgi:hypothetical protein
MECCSFLQTPGSARETISHVHLFRASQIQAVRLDVPNLMRHLRRTVKIDG